MVSFETASPKSGEVKFSTSYQVVRKEVHGLPPEKMGMKPVKLSDDQRKLLLSADARVPITGRPLELLAGKELPAEHLKLARLLYDRVDEHVKYDKSKPGYGRGDVLWVCDSRFGNCTDFHSLFISLARAKGIPARFEIGFSVPEKRGEGPIAGYHCWAFFWLDKQGWVPVDISEADKNPSMKEYYFGNLTENRVTFSQGRDLTLVPQQAGEPLNFFIYPYVEVDGKAWPAEKVKLEVSYKDE
ncbi:MAG: transglutaminase domain-containing protein [Pirellulaceae bacterium]|nr:transglutaminase domain-containing protein [Pirellulaceae bacterium]